MIDLRSNTGSTRLLRIVTWDRQVRHPHCQTTKAGTPAPTLLRAAAEGFGTSACCTDGFQAWRMGVASL